MSKEHLYMCVPVSSMAAANAIAAVVDTDVGGDRTFLPNRAATAEGPPTHCWAGVVLPSELAALIRTRDANAYHEHINALAASRGRSAVTLDACVEVASTLLLEDEITQVLVES